MQRRNNKLPFKLVLRRAGTLLSVLKMPPLGGVTDAIILIPDVDEILMRASWVSLIIGSASALVLSLPSATFKQALGQYAKAEAKRTRSLTNSKYPI